MKVFIIKVIKMLSKMIKMLWVVLLEVTGKYGKRCIPQKY